MSTQYPCRKLTPGFIGRVVPQDCDRRFGRRAGSVRPCAAVSARPSTASPKMRAAGTNKATEPVESDGLRRPEVRAHAGFVLTVVYRVAGSMRNRPGSRAAGVRSPQGPHAGPLCQDRRSYSVAPLQQVPAEKPAASCATAQGIHRRCRRTSSRASAQRHRVGQAPWPLREIVPNAAVIGVLLNPV